MKRVSHLSFVVLLLCAACQGESVTALDAARQGPSLSVAGSSGCHSVSGTISETGIFPNFTGGIAGDLKGTSTTVLSSDIRTTGLVGHFAAQRTLVITGSSIPELVGRTLHETIEGVTISNAGPVIRINERTRIDNGAERGSLTEHGILDVRPLPWMVGLEYHGVICP